MRGRHCTRCSRSLSAYRADARFCSDGCRSANWRRRGRVTRVLTRRRRCEACRKAIPLAMRPDARFCSNRCRQRAHRKRRETRARTPAKAHQRVIRERLSAADGQAHTPDIATAQVREIPLAEATALIKAYEFLGTMPAIVRHCYGVFFDGRCGGAVVYGDDYAENLGVWDKYGYTGKIICLSRGACAHWAPPHAASKLIRRSMRLLPARYAVVTATVDAGAGEIGTIYQAAGFDYVGVMRAGGRATVKINGRRISERQAGRIAGTRGAHALARLGLDAVPVARRARYFAFLGSKRERARLRAAIAYLIKPYPSRRLTSP